MTVVMDSLPLIAAAVLVRLGTEVTALISEGMKGAQRRLELRESARCTLVGTLPPGSRIVESGRSHLLIQVGEPKRG